MKREEFLRLKREAQASLNTLEAEPKPLKYFRVHYRTLPHLRGKMVEESTVIVALNATEALRKAKKMGLRTPYLNVAKKAAFI